MSEWADLAVRRMIAGVGLALLMLVAGCGSSFADPDDDWLPQAFQGPDGEARQEAFALELAEATEYIDYEGIEPAEIAYGRTLERIHCGGLTFRRYVIDGREQTTTSHEALASGKAGGKTVKIPNYHDPNGHFVVVRQIFKVEERWEVIIEDWVLLPPHEKCAATIQSVIDAGEVAGAEDMLGHPSAGQGFRIQGFQARGFKTQVVPELGGSGSRASARAPAKGGSGLSHVPRLGMKARTVEDVRGNRVPIWGQTRSTSTTPGHDKTMEAEAVGMARSGQYEYVTIQRSWRTATGRVGKSRRIPDIIGVRHDGKVDAVEIRSKSDTDDSLLQRLHEGRHTLPPERRGDIKIMSPEPKP